MRADKKRAALAVRRRRVVAAIGLTALMVSPAVAAAAPNDTVLVSRGVGGAKGDAASIDASISGDGRYIAFVSDATNLTPISSGEDVYVRDVVAGTTTLVSVAHDGDAADDVSGHPSISADGRFVAFESDATNLHPDGERASHVYLRDLQSGTTEIVSRASDGTPANGVASDPAISPNGRYVAFIYSGTDLSPDDSELITPDVYLRDLSTGATTLVSRATGASGADANGFSGMPSVSSTGRVAFVSDATNLAGALGPAPKVYVRDLATSTTTLASRATGATGMAGLGANPVISGDGRHVAFAGMLFPSGAQLYVRDLETATTTLVSRADGPTGAPADAGGPGTVSAISADGRYIAFDSLARNLDPADTDSIADVFVRDMTTQTTILISRASQAGAKGNAGSRRPALSSGGGFVAFDSEATNLSPDDGDSLLDVFRREIGPDLGPADSDGDGVADPADRCPTVPAATLDGCPAQPPSDGDADGVPDAADRCPTVAAATSDGCPAPPPSDGDADGVPDAADRCPTVAAATSDGCPVQPPSAGDGDGVPDAADRCPTVAAATGDGCPPGATHALETSLTRAGTVLRRLGIRGLLSKRGAKIAFDAPGPGRLQASVTATVRGGRATAAKRVAVLKGARTFATAGRAKLKLTLTRNGQRALSRARRAKLTLTLTFVDVAARTFTGSATVKLKR